LLTLYRVNKILRKLFKKEKGLPEYDVKNVAAFYECVSSFYDFLLENVASYKQFFRSANKSLATQRKENRNLLFRPVGLVVLARLYVIFSSREKLADLKRGLALIRWESPGGVFDSILWTGGKIEARADNVVSAVNLCAYLLRQDIEGRTELKNRIAKVTKNPKYKLPPRLL
jgi:DNA sulfur modification protein DndB